MPDTANEELSATASSGAPYGAAEGQDPALSRLSLSELARHFGTDKWGGDDFPPPRRHRYTEHYERHLAGLRNEKFVLFEIGIGGYEHELEGGASLRMWKHFFPNAAIVGLDIEDKAFVREPRIHTYQGSQTDESVLAQIVSEQGPPTVVVDDGSHRPEDIRASFTHLFPHLPDGGIYIIEDTQTSYWPQYGGSRDLNAPDTTMALGKQLMDGLNWEEWLPRDGRPRYTDVHVSGLHVYHNLLIVEKGTNRETGRMTPVVDS